MKSRRAEQVLQAASFTNEHGYQYVCIDSAYAAVELAERDAEKEIAHYRKELEESKQRKELARKVINDQRKEIERLKARAEEAFCFKECGVTCCDTNGCENLKAFLQKLDEQ